MKKALLAIILFALTIGCVMTGTRTTIATSTDYISSKNGSFKQALTDKYWWTPKTYQFSIYDSGQRARVYTAKVEDFDEVIVKGCEPVVKNGATSVFVYSTTPVDKEYVEVAFMLVDNTEGICTLMITMILDKQKITKPEEYNREYAYNHYRQYSYDGANMKLMKESFTDKEMRDFLVKTGKIKE